MSKTTPYPGAKSKSPWFLAITGLRKEFQQNSRLKKQPRVAYDTEMGVDEEIFLSESLNRVNYIKADLKQVSQNCKDLTTDQQRKLLQILQYHKTHCLGKKGHWKGQPVTIKVIEVSPPVWAKPYPIPLKNCDVFKNDVYQQSEHYENYLWKKLKTGNGSHNALGFPKKMVPSGS